jgi:hypothetical protein
MSGRREVDMKGREREGREGEGEGKGTRNRIWGGGRGGGGGGVPIRKYSHVMVESIIDAAPSSFAFFLKAMCAAANNTIDT